MVHPSSWRCTATADPSRCSGETAEHGHATAVTASESTQLSWLIRMVSSVTAGRGRRLAIPLLLCASLIPAGCSSPTGPTATRVAVTSVSPPRGSTGGGTLVTIAGSGFAAGAAVLIGGVQATEVDVRSPTSLTAVTPSRLSAGSSEVTV